MSFCIHTQRLMESGFMKLESAARLRVNPMSIPLGFQAGVHRQDFRRN